MTIPDHDRGHRSGWLDRILSPGRTPPSPLRLDEQELSKPRIELWETSPEREWYMTRRVGVWRFVLLGLAMLIVSAVLVQPGWRTPRQLWWALILGSAAVVILAYCTVPYFAAQRAFRSRRRSMAVYRAEVALADLGGDPQLPLHRLFELNRKQLDAYQELSRRQQRSAFRLAQAASLIGLAVLVAGIALSLRQSPASDKYVVAGLTGLGTLLSAFLGNTFLTSARRADSQLNLYYREPHMMGRILVGERIASTMGPEDKSAEAKAMIATLMSWPIPTDQAAGDEERRTSGNGS